LGWSKTWQNGASAEQSKSSNYCWGIFQQVTVLMTQREYANLVGWFIMVNNG
jgi:hypothetical protein